MDKNCQGNEQIAAKSSISMVAWRKFEKCKDQPKIYCTRIVSGQFDSKNKLEVDVPLI